MCYTFFHFCIKLFNRTYDLSDKHYFDDLLQFFSFLLQNFSQDLRLSWQKTTSWFASFFFIFVSKFLAGPMDLSVKHHFMICSTFFYFYIKIFDRTFLTNTFLMICFNYFFIFVTKFFTGPMAFLTKHHFLICLIFFIFVSNFLAGPMDLSVKDQFMICSTFFKFLHQTF